MKADDCDFSDCSKSINIPTIFGMGHLLGRHNLQFGTSCIA